MLKIITEAKEIKKYQKTISNILTEKLSFSGSYTIGYPSGNWKGNIQFNRKIWWQYSINNRNKHMNCFGLSSELVEGKSVNIVVQISIPLSGIDKSIAGFFAIDSESKKVFLMHRGKIGGGRKGIGRKEFLNWYPKNLATVIDAEENEDSAILVAEITPKTFIQKLTAFINDVYQFKQYITTIYLSDEQLNNFIEKAKIQPSKRKITTEVYERNSYISEYAKRHAKGKCQLCKSPAPFRNKLGQPFLETHHIVWLSQGGADTIDNTVALCPNCHRKMHNLNFKKDVLELKRIVKNRK